MVDGRWQAGKVTIDLNVGRSSRSLLIHSPYAPPSITPTRGPAFGLPSGPRVRGGRRPWTGWEGKGGETRSDER